MRGAESRQGIFQSKPTESDDVGRNAPNIVKIGFVDDTPTGG